MVEAILKISSCYSLFCNQNLTENTESILYLGVPLFCKKKTGEKVLEPRSNAEGNKPFLWDFPEDIYMMMWKKLMSVLWQLGRSFNFYKSRAFDVVSVSSFIQVWIFCILSKTWIFLLLWKSGKSLAFFIVFYSLQLHPGLGLTRLTFPVKKTFKPLSWLVTMRFSCLETKQIGNTWEYSYPNPVLGILKAFPALWKKL